MKEYQSTEERVINSRAIRGTGSFLFNVGRSFYGMVASILRIPTVIRKYHNKQTFPHRIGLDYAGLKNSATSLGCFVGAAIGTTTDIVAILCAIDSAQSRNYVPLAILGATNFASGLYELGRLSRTRQEHSELVSKIEKESEKQAKITA